MRNPATQSYVTSNGASAAVGSAVAIASKPTTVMPEITPSTTSMQIAPGSSNLVSATDPSRCISTTDMSPYRVSTGGVESGGGGGNLGVAARVEFGRKS